MFEPPCDSRDQAQFLCKSHANSSLLPVSYPSSPEHLSSPGLVTGCFSKERHWSPPCALRIHSEGSCPQPREREPHETPSSASDLRCLPPLSCEKIDFCGLSPTLYLLLLVVVCVGAGGQLAVTDDKLDPLTLWCSGELGAT